MYRITIVYETYKNANIPLMLSRKFKVLRLSAGHSPSTNHGKLKYQYESFLILAGCEMVLLIRDVRIAGNMRGVL